MISLHGPIRSVAIKRETRFAQNRQNKDFHEKCLISSQVQETQHSNLN